MAGTRPAMTDKVIKAITTPMSRKLFGTDGIRGEANAEPMTAATMLAVAIAAGGLYTSREDRRHLAGSARLGRARRLDDAQGRYIEFVKASFPRGRRLDGLKIVIDCAHGAGYKVAPTVLHELGATVIPVAVQPDGFNINKDCGAV